MRTLATLLLSFSISHVLAQETFPRVEKIVVQDKLFHGHIDKFPMTMYLKFNQFSNYHAGVYSIEGWYYYDDVKTKIPLAGLYDMLGLTLYHFQDTSKSNELLHFREMKSNHSEDMEYYKTLKGFSEKFVLGENGNRWTDGDSTLEVSLGQEALSVQSTSEQLHLASNTVFDLHNFGNWLWNFELIAHRSGTIILGFEYGSRLHVMARCGAGLEKGFLVLKFNQDYTLDGYEKFIYESCNNSIGQQEKASTKNGITVYYCCDYSKDKKYDLIVDLNQMKVEKTP